MRLKELSAISGISQASIKYYLREGLLQPGRQINQTLAEYDEGHVERLRLISTLRRLEVPIDSIRFITARIDDPECSMSDLLGYVQLIMLGREPDFSRPPTPEHPAVSRLVDDMGWSRRPGQTLSLLSETVRAITDLGVPVSDDVLLGYARAADAVAEVGTGVTLRADTRDRAVLIASVGMHSYNKLLLSMVAVAQASAVVSATDA